MSRCHHMNLSPLESNMGHFPQLHEGSQVGGERLHLRALQPARLLASARATVRSEHPAEGACGQAPTNRSPAEQRGPPRGVNTKPLYYAEQGRLRPAQNSQAQKSPREAPLKGSHIAVT